MHDPLRRQIGYLRLSLTAACQMRCSYCRPTRLSKPNRDTELTPAELEAVVSHLVEAHGISKVRLTGGDPTARGDLMQIIERIAALEGISDLAMTSNGLSLASHAWDYARAGLGRINVSLDSLDADQFARITGIDGMQRVIAGIDAAIDAGLVPLKINTVVMAGENEHQLPALVSFAADRGVAIRFIELMPMGPLASQWHERYITAAQMMTRLSNANVDRWQSQPQGHDSAHRYVATLDDGREVDVGFITPMSCNFCAACNRLRLTSDGGIYPCLMDEPRGSYLDAVRPRFDPDRFDELLADALTQKAAEHPARGFAVMTTIGG